MIGKNNITKLTSVILIISIILPSVLFLTPKKVEAGGWPVFDYLNSIFNKLTSVSASSTATSSAATATLTLEEKLERLGKLILKQIAKRVLAEMTKSTINWINSGFHGSPLFLENPDSFFKDIAKTQVKSLVDMIGYDTFRFPFGKQTALNVIDSYKSQFEINVQYSLSKVINDPDLLRQYRDNFNVGGWNGFLINTQYPQNNYLGFNMMVQETLASQLAGTLQAPAEKVRETLELGMGFLSPQTCPSNTKYNNGYNEFSRPTFVPPTFDQSRQADYGYEEEYNAERGAAYADWAEKNTCPGGLVATTPGSVAANQIFTATNTPFLTTALDGALGNSIATIFDALLNKLIGDGLTSLKSSVNPASVADNWSYEGNTLGGGYTSYNNSIWDTSDIDSTPIGVLLVNNSQNPPRIEVDIDNIIIATISGGNGNYGVETEPNKNIAVTTVAGTGLIIAGVGKGETHLIIKDSSIPIQTVRVDIKVIGPEDLLTNPKDVYIDLALGSAGSTEITGGIAPYFVESILDETIVTVPPDQIEQISEATLMIIGIKSGQTSIILKDSSNPVQIAQINVTVTDPNNPLGTCVMSGQINEPNP
ncbi:hypothetical protein HYZ82_01255 [Candidatus Nomurabacteria bacterium]|nr:hypothetical protein [Candidatus Nomurabacteria bacterium]